MLMKRSGEFSPLIVYVALNRPPFLGDSHARFSTSEAMADHQRRKEKQEKQGKLWCRRWYVLKESFQLMSTDPALFSDHSYISTSNRNRHKCRPKPDVR
jgi:hypothetical protein